MRQRIDIRGIIIPNDYKDMYEWFGMESTCPADVNKILNMSADDLDVYINSNGGEIASGSEIYTMLRDAARTRDVMIHITGAAHSAASVIACAARSEMSPTALMMVHCVSSYVIGNHADMEHEAEVLRTADQALSSAYTEKSGMTEQEVLDMMAHETWLTAERAKELGLVDEIMFAEPEPAPLVASAGNILTREMLQHMRDSMNREPVTVNAAEIAKAQRLQQGRLAMCRKA